MMGSWYLVCSVDDVEEGLGLGAVSSDVQVGAVWCWWCVVVASD